MTRPGRVHIVGAGIAGLAAAQVADALGGPAAKPRKAVFLGLRYAFLGGGAYVILKFSAISLSAALSGLFVSIAAVVLEIIFELAYARNGTLHH